MIAVIFEVEPAIPDRYFDIAASLKPELEQIPGFISVERFESLTTPETHQMDYRERPPVLEGPLLRFHVGLEDPEDLIADLKAGFAAWNDALA